MPFVQIIHWKPAEAEGLLAACRKAGATVTAECVSHREIPRRMPSAVVIDLSRLPSHGREVGAWIRETKKTRGIPLLYVDGEKEKVERIRALLPDATYTTAAQVTADLRAALRKGPRPAVTPPPAIVRFGGRSAAQKMGIKPGMTVGVYHPPDGYESLIGGLPEDMEFREEPARPADLTLWFVHDYDGLLYSLDTARRLAPRTRLWFVWRKGANREVTFNSILKTAAEVGLALSKLCAVDDTWSATWLVPRTR